MARLINRLNDLRVKRLNERGYYCDGLGLYMRVSRSLSKSWVVRYQIGGRNREMGLGPYPVFTLADARDRAKVAQQQLSDGLDPIEQRQIHLPLSARKPDPTRTFTECAKKYIEFKKSEWRNKKHKDQWESTLKSYAMKTIGDLDVDTISTKHILRILEPIWHTKTETATRLRGRIERILDWAKSKNLRTGDNPARWKGHLQNLLAAPEKIAVVEHHPSLAYQDTPAFHSLLLRQDNQSALALRFLILCASRSGEVLGASWQEIDFKSKTWNIPGARMKAGKPHQVPLTEEAMALLHLLNPLRNLMEISNCFTILELRRLLYQTCP
jgi:hypothetical protein